MNGRGLGYKVDAPDERDLRFGAVGSSLGASLFPEADLSGYVARIRDQRATSSCVGQALAAALEITAGARQQRALHVSARWLYTIAREAERRGSIADDGSFPRLALEAARRRGLLAEEVFPFSEEAIDVRPAPLDGVGAFAGAGLSYYRIDDEGPARLRAVADALERGFGVLFGLSVDARYQENMGQRIDRLGPSIGGHMQVCVAVKDDAVRVLNSWGEAWGDGGFVDFEPAFFAEVPMSDVYVITWVPTDAS